MTEKKYLPIGTVCKLKNAKRNLMIIGFAVKKQAGDDADKVYDYLACIYPIGLFDQNQNFMFNHDDIEEIAHMGLITNEEKEFKKQLMEELAEKGIQ